MSNSQSAKESWAGMSLLLTFTTAVRCVRNFQYYRASTVTLVERTEIINSINSLEHSGYQLHNSLLNQMQNGLNPFVIALSKTIADELEHIHRKLLFFDAEQIVDMIVLIDKERAFWQQSDQPQFYREKLSVHLDNQFPNDVSKLKKLANRLPERSD